MNQVLLVLRHGVLRIDAIVPALIPDEAGQLVALPLVRREVRLEIGQRLAHVGQHLRVIRADRTAGAGRAEVLVETLAAPGDLDEQHLVVEVVAEDVAELQLRTEVMLAAVDGEAHRERPGKQRLLLALVAHPHILADGPALLALEVLDQRSLVRIGEQGGEGALAVVVVLAGQVRDGLPLHVRLAGQDEHFHRFGRLGCATEVQGTAEQGCGYEKQSVHDRTWCGDRAV